MGDMVEWLRRCAEARAAGKGIPDAQLFRRMLTHDDWFATDDAEVLGAGGTVAIHCSDLALPEGVAKHSMNGLQLALALHKSVNEMRLHFEPDSPPLVCNAAECDLFRSYLKVTVVESLLLRVYEGSELDIENPYARLQDGDFFVLCAGGHGSGPLLLALAPDPIGGRRLAAAFTAQDALQLFVVSGESNTSREQISMRLSGRELFQHIASRSEELDGVVFNPAGPGQPIPMSTEFARAVVSSG
uniref:SseB protein N-terminal domain-containing protein n=1 Tax=Haptolina brevifila TaxID=156173 RepID=A0A7S2HME3_9EUKA